MQFNEYVRQYSKVSKRVQKACELNIKALLDYYKKDQGKIESRGNWIRNKYSAFICLMSHRGGLGDYNGTTDPTKVPEGLIETRELIKKDICPDFLSDTKSLDFRTDPNIIAFSDFLTHCQTEAMWHAVARPYYNVYPIVYEHMVSGIDIGNWKWNDIIPPYSPLLLKFPIGREPYGIASMMVRKSDFREDNGRVGWGRHPTTDETIGIDEQWFEGDPATDDGMAKSSRMWYSLANVTKKMQLEIEVQFAPRYEDTTYSSISLMNTRDDSSLLTCLDNSNLRNLMQEDLFNNRKDENDWPSATESQRVNQQFLGEFHEGIGGTLDFNGLPPQVDSWDMVDMKPANPEHNQKVSEKRSEFHKWVLQMVILLSEIHKTPGMIEDAILARDKDEYVNASELRKQRLADKAAKRTGCKGWSIGKQQQERSDSNKSNPHWVKPFLRNQACGPRFSKRKVILIEGHVRGAASIEDVPTGFEGHKQPEQPEYKYRPPISPALRAKVFARDKNTCRTCGRKPKDGIKLEAGHVVSHKNGGKASMDNLITQCNVCNSGQSSRNIKKGQLA